MFSDSSVGPKLVLFLWSVYSRAPFMFSRFFYGSFEARRKRERKERKQGDKEGDKESLSEAALTGRFI